ncbi:pterin-4-alpha-carbinolamine dehydratase 2, mitochondrial-like isoform X3 [Miscanthus floridulus]|uniref:pterin-4-alpha-carbinolamine dehydratase 2, mitochondrial-like isoform X3 n=1 Tax=Miscanthus floridulus TaxID=154761 RepID=UPI003458C9A5
MLRASTVHARLLLSRSYVGQVKAAARWPLVRRKPSHFGSVRHRYLCSPFYQKMDTRGQGENKTLTARGCHNSPESQELAMKSCVPCNSKDLHPMSEDSAKKMLEQVNGWELITEGGILKLHRAWKVKNFVKGLEFFQLVAAIAEEEGGLTSNGFILAAKINNLTLEGIIRKKAT